jgi:L,D-transpeptidase YbiS
MRRPASRLDGPFIALAASGLVVILGALGGGYEYGPPRAGHAADLEPIVFSAPATTSAEELRGLRRLERELEGRIRGQAPRGDYVVVDRGENRLYLRNRSRVHLDAVVSTGSGTILRETGGQRRTWAFDTPPGRHRVLRKKPNPVWTKPDWAFLEVGEPIPASVEDRIETGSLGEYALDLGEGYLIHGTLYERLLGWSVTHGCVRVGREDLRTLYRGTDVGTPVFIF